MAQIPIKLNLLSADFPLCSQFMGRSAFAANADQQETGTRDQEVANRHSSPEVYYMHNVMPTIEGYKSIAYEEVINRVPDTEVFVQIIPIRDSSVNGRGYLGITASGKTYLVSSTTVDWLLVNVVDQPLNSEVTYGFVNGITYVCYSNFAVFKINLNTNTLDAVTLSGITESNLIGISASNNYLLAHDGQYIYWSSAVDPEDFTPSVATGAGSAIPNSLLGNIVLLNPINSGIAIYSSANIIVGQFSGNVQYPWIFKEAVNSSGISSIGSVSEGGDNGCNYAWTSVGLLRVTSAGCTPFLPQITDFISSRIMEDYDINTHTHSVDYINADLLIHINYSTARYIVISYGVSALTHCIVYDTILKRFGKLRVEHVMSFELTLSTTGESPKVDNLINITYDDLIDGETFDNYRTLSPTAASPKRVLAFLKSDGSIVVANFDESNFVSDAVLITGKFQIMRQKLTTVQGIELETSERGNTNLQLTLLSSYDGKNISTTPVAPYNNYIAPTVFNAREYMTRQTGKNHSLVISGAFHIISVLLWLTLHGRR